METNTIVYTNNNKNNKIIKELYDLYVENYDRKNPDDKYRDRVLDLAKEDIETFESIVAIYKNKNLIAYLAGNECIEFICIVEKYKNSKTVRKLINNLEKNHFKMKE